MTGTAPQSRRSTFNSAPACARVLLWALGMFFATGNSIGSLTTKVPGDAGDGLFVYELTSWGADRARHGFAGYWSSNFFAGTLDPMSFSDNLIGPAVLLALLRPFFGSVLAYNLLVGAAWTACVEFSYLLARRVLPTIKPELDPRFVAAGSTLAALGFSCSSIVMGHGSHAQLVFSAWTIPAAFLAMLRILERPSLKHGAVLGLVLAFSTITGPYYALYSMVAIGLIFVVWRFRAPSTEASKVGLAMLLAGVVLAVASAPTLIHALRLWQRPGFSRDYEPKWAFRPIDLTGVPRGNRLWGSTTYFLDHPARNPEMVGFPGLIIALLGLAGLVLCWRQRRHTTERHFLATALLAIGAVALLMAAGRFELGGIRVPAWDVFAAVVPGYQNTRALVRALVLFQMVLSIFAGLGLANGLAFLAQRTRGLKPVGAVAVGVLLFAFVEGTVKPNSVTLPDRGSDPPNAVIAASPKGRVLELPMADPDVIWSAQIEATRLVAADHDGHPRINGYSGFFPPKYPTWIARSSSLPSPQGMAFLKEFQVRYLLIRTKPLLVGDPRSDRAVSASPYAAMNQKEAQTLLESLPGRCVEKKTETSTGWVVELAAECR